jgi:hypothetical protein
VFRYIVDAVHLIADGVWMLLPRYRFEPASGAWQHPSRSGGLTDETAPETALGEQLDEARWFPLPGEALTGRVQQPALHPARDGDHLSSHVAARQR